MYCEQFVPGCVEGNRHLVDNFGAYLPLKSFFLNGVGILGFFAPLAIALGAAFRRWYIASIPFWYLGIALADQGARNLLLIVAG